MLAKRAGRPDPVPSRRAAGVGFAPSRWMHGPNTCGTGKELSWAGRAMPSDQVHAESRRRFLQYLAASPLLAAWDGAAFADLRKRDPSVESVPSSSSKGV